jgi:hypothetical protein
MKWKEREFSQRVVGPIKGTGYQPQSGCAVNEQPSEVNNGKQRSTVNFDTQVFRLQEKSD